MPLCNWIYQNCLNQHHSRCVLVCVVVSSALYSKHILLCSLKKLFNIYFYCYYNACADEKERIDGDQFLHLHALSHQKNHHDVQFFIFFRKKSFYVCTLLNLNFPFFWRSVCVGLKRRKRESKKHKGICLTSWIK